MKARLVGGPSLIHWRILSTAIDDDCHLDPAGYTIIHSVYDDNPEAVCEGDSGAAVY
jgi:hypothetical protein